MNAEEMVAVFELAKEAYKKGFFERALGRNKKVAKAESGDVYQVRALRFCGVCLYRLGRLKESLQELQSAKALALEIDDQNEAQLVDNHLGATWRRLGRPDEALKVFQSALQRVSRVGGLTARARILGNLGALYDEAGQRALADEYYARYEELCMLGDDKHHLANAHGLMSRVEILRGRLDEAQRHVEEERQLAEELDDNGRLLTSLRHQANLCIARARQLRREESNGEADDLLEEATRCLDAAEKRLAKQELHRRVAVLRARAEIAELQGCCPAALVQLESALVLVSGDDAFAEQRASVLKELAGIARTLGLSGEALFYLEKAAEVRWELLERLSGHNKDIKELFAPRFEELRSLAESLMQEARAVPRDAAERKRLVSLLARLGMKGAHKKIGEIEEAVSLKLRARASAKMYWQSALGEYVFSQLHKHSQDDLIISDIVYHGAVDDLGRSAHLVAVVFERELRERFIQPVVGLLRQRQSWSWNDAVLDEIRIHRSNVSMRLMLRLVGFVVGKRDDLDFVCEVRRVFSHCLSALSAVLSVDKSVKSVCGVDLKIMDVRNRVAHGRYDGRMPTRLDVDAFRRHLLFGAQSPLALLVGISARPT